MTIMPSRVSAITDPVAADSREAIRLASEFGMYQPTQEHDACGVGFVAHIRGRKSHSIVEQGLLILKNLDHRGAVGADPLMGDGAGVLIQIPDAVFREDLAKQGIALPPVGEYGVGMIFLPKEHASRLACEQELERAVRASGQVLLGWRDVPIDRDMPMSPTVKATEPVIRQMFIGRGQDVMVTDALERKLYIVRKSAGHAIQALKLKHGKEFFVPSMSARTTVYKGLLLADQVGVYYRRPRRSADRLGHRVSRINASRPTRFPVGSSRIPIAWSRTTARSTRSRATSTGSTRASRPSRRRCWARTSTRSGR